MRFSFSRIDAFLSCPYRFRLRYIDKLDTLPDYDNADNPLTIGTAMHHGIEQGADAAIREYVMSYPVDTDDIETEAVKLEVLVPKVRAMIDPNAIFEFRMETENFLGFADYIDPKTGTLLDFKYSNNEKHYLESAQIHVYRYLLERYYGMHFERIGYLFIPKIQTKDSGVYDSVQMYRNWLREELGKVQPRISYVTYDENKAIKTLGMIPRIESVRTFAKERNRLCWYCDFRRYCETEGKEDYMILPKNERHAAGTATQRKLWIYGAPFSGKTTLADQFPDVLMLNTDGNVKFVTAPCVRIKESLDGHIKKQAWEVFKETIDELAKKDNEYKSIVVDLVEDTYEACRLYMYKKLGITHESDSSFKAWDMVRTEFLSTMKKLMNLDYENIVLISHEDTSKDITKRSGDAITAIKPNIQDKIANKLAGMVDAVIRCVVIDGEHMLSFKTDEVQFGGGRIDFGVSEIPNSYESLARLYGNVGREKTAEMPKTPKVTEKEEASNKLSNAEPPKEETKPYVAEGMAQVATQDVAEELGTIPDAVEMPNDAAPQPPRRRRRRAE